jgi:hypothetical protein
MSQLTDWLEQHQGTCSWKSHFGIECPGCGMQSAFIELLKGHLFESMRIYPALIPMMVLFVFLLLHLFFNYRKGALIIKILFIFTVCIVFIHFMYRIFTL